MVAQRLVAACLIVRNEADRLPDCLTAVGRLADEMVVHDTGSSDNTAAVARHFRASVIEGEWRDDFGAARNHALDACTADWIVHVDADEVIGGDLIALRRLLESAPAEVDGFIVAIDNLLDDGTGSSYTSTACRIFRRRRGHWEGALHEQVVARPGQPPLRLADAPDSVRITHHGYLRAAMDRGDKLNRNIRLARAAVDAVQTTGHEPPPAALLDLGRALKATGAIEEAATHLLDAAARAGRGPVAREALAFASSCLLGLGRIADAEAAATQLRAWSDDPSIADFISGQIALQRGDAAAALARFDTITDLASEDGRQWPPGVVALHRALAHSLLEQWAEATGCFAEAIERGAAINAELGALPPAAAHLVAQQLWAQLGPNQALLAALASACTSFDIEAALDWTIRLRDAGVTDPCPLLLWAASDDQPAPLRAYAAGAAAALGDERGRPRLTAVAPLVADDMAPLLAEQLRDMTPELEAAFWLARDGDALRGENISHLR